MDINFPPKPQNADKAEPDDPLVRAAIRAGHETTDVSVRGLFAFAGGLFVTLVAIMVGLVIVFRVFAVASARVDARIARHEPGAASRVRVPPDYQGPLLQVKPEEDLRWMRNHNNIDLDSYGWMDQAAGVVRLPIDRAVDLIAERGLAARFTLSHTGRTPADARATAGVRTELATMMCLPSILCMGLLAVSFPPAPPTRLSDTTPASAARLSAAAKFTQNLGAAVPLDAVFHDESGRVMPLGALLGQRPAILVLGYHECPMLCSLVLGGLVESLTEMRATTGRDFDLIDVSISPADTPALADRQRRMYFKRYLRAGSDEGWHFLTSPEEGPIRRLADAVGFHYAYDAASKQYAHPSGLVILTPQGKVSRYFFGVTFDAGQLQSALALAGQRQVGSPIEELLLVCFHYNPIHGRYGAAIMGAIRVGGALTLVALAVLIVRLTRREQSVATVAVKQQC